MIDRNTGEIKAEPWTGSLTPDTTRTAFVASALFSGAEVAVKNEPWCSWHLPKANSGGHEWHLTVYFHGELLASVHMMIDAPEFGSSWSDWSREKEQRRKLRHDAALKADLGPGPYELPWGSVWSGYDAKGGSSSVVVTYRKKDELPNQALRGTAYRRP